MNLTFSDLDDSYYKSSSSRIGRIHYIFMVLCLGFSSPISQLHDLEQETFLNLSPHLLEFGLVSKQQSFLS
jgi:hypothetical protein